MNKKTIKQKLRNLKLKTIALWWLLTRKHFFLFAYNTKKGKQISCSFYNVDILSFIDQIQRWHNMLTAHDILVRNEVKELIEKIKKQDRVYLGPETK